MKATMLEEKISGLRMRVMASGVAESFNRNTKKIQEAF